MDLYLPAADAPRPAIVFLHGGTIRPDMTPPREWPCYVGYASVAAARGIVGVMLDHPFHTKCDLPTSAKTIAETIDLVRSDPRVDSERIALWGCSAGGLLLSDWLREAPPWIRCIAASYPLLRPFPHWNDDPRFVAMDALHAGSPPLVITLVGLEREAVAVTQPPFLARVRELGIPLDLVEVPGGQHSFEILDHTDESRAAVERAFDLVTARLLRPDVA